MLKSARKLLSAALCFATLLMTMFQIIPAQVAVAANQMIIMDKPTYIQGQPITLSYTGASKKDWIGLYMKGAVPQSSNPSLDWSYTSSAGEPDGKLTFTKGLPPGEYEAVYMEDDGYNIFQRAPFSIISLAAPKSMTITDTDTDPTQISGEVTIQNPDDMSNILNYLLYWGNDVGKLPGQPAIATIPLTVTGATYLPATYTFQAGTPIPKGATKLIAYSNSDTGSSSAGAEAAIPGLTTEKPAVSFEVISDMHITSNPDHYHNKNFENVLKDIIQMDPNSDGLMTVGDNTNNGDEAEYQELERIFNQYKSNLPPTYFVQGNHDVRWGDWDQYSERFMKYTNMKSNYYDFWIKGYHFIFLGTEKGLKDYSYLSDTQLKWLDAKLSEDESKNKPAFIFLHQPLKNTVSGANESYLPTNNWYGVRQDKELKLILAKHPQSMMFSGHTHWELGAKDTMYNAKYATLFNTASTAYLWTDSNAYKDGSQGYFVKVYDDKVVVKGRDFANNSWIENAQFEVKLPAQIPVVNPATDPDLTLGSPSIKTVKASYAPAEPVQVAYTGSVLEDWIGIFPAGTKLGNNVKAIALQKTNSVQQPDGTMTFSGLNLAPGKYDAVYVGEAEYRSDNDNLELGRVTFEVASTPPVVDKHPFVVTSAALATNTSMVDATVTVKPTTSQNTAVVVFQLMKGNTPVSIASYQAPVPAEGGSFNAKFNVNRNNGYQVRVLIVSNFSADLTNVGTLLAEPVTLQ